MSGAGKVFLVGAGPGDPDLITLRGANLLRDADVVIYDALASDDLLDLAPPHARRINVGKRGHDTPTRSQEETTALIIEEARAGNRVVRLKGGDPFVFGRGGEEASACHAAGIPFEVVPGVSAVLAAPAAAGIPVTDRRHSASFAVVTGHKDPTKVTEETRWELLAQAVDTLVIVMGMRNLESIVARVLASGRSPATPAAVVMNGTLASQRTVEAPLGELVAAVKAAGLGSPATVVIGEAVKLRSSLAWFERRPLFGWRVLVTRAADQAGPLASALREAGAEPVLLPMIRLLPATDTDPIDVALAKLDDYDVLLLTSANAAHFFARRAADVGRSLNDLRARVVCVGPRTAEAALRLGLPVHGLPGARFDAEGMLEELQRMGLPDGCRVLLPRSEKARDVLPDGLRAAGSIVDSVTVYRNVAPNVDATGLRAELLAGELHALTFTSPSTVTHFSAMLDDECRAAARKCVIAGIGRVTAAALLDAGLPADVVPERSGAPELVAALVVHAATRERTPR